MPYTAVDGIMTATDSSMVELFDRTVEEGLLNKVFYDGEILDAQSFLRFVKAPGNLFYVVFDGLEAVAYTWLSHLESRAARIHFCVFKRHHGLNAIDIGKFVLRKLVELKSSGGEYIFDVLIGLTPNNNKLALRFAQSCGFKICGVVPNAVFNSISGKSEDATVSWYTRSTDNDD